MFCREINTQISIYYIYYKFNYSLTVICVITLIADIKLRDEFKDVI